MNRQNSGLTHLALLILLALGGWLAFGSGVRLLAGLILVAVSSIGLVLLARRENVGPLTPAEADSWESVRALGKPRYVRRAVLYGVALCTGFILFEAVSSYWKGAPLAGGADLLALVGVSLIFVGGAYYMAVRQWALNEQRYKEASRPAAQPRFNFEVQHGGRAL